MNDTQIGLLLILMAMLSASAVFGFRMARGNRNPLGTLCPSFVAMYAVLTYVWHMGTLAAFPSFVTGNGSRPFIVFPLLMIVMTAILTTLATFVWCGLFMLLKRAAEAYTRWMAQY